MNRRNFLRSASAVSGGLALSGTMRLSAQEIASTAALTDRSRNFNPQMADSDMLENLRRKIVDYYRFESNPHKGLVADKTQPGSPSSIAATGMGLSVFVVAVERGILSRAEVVERILTLLRFLEASHQRPEPNATGYKGFYYHFLDMQTGLRAEQCELSTIDTAILMAGILSAAGYFTAASSKEIELRKLAEILYRRVDWQWALDKGRRFPTVGNPNQGFFRTAGTRVTAKPSSFMRLPWDPRRFLSSRRVTKSGFRRLNGKKSTIQSICTLDRFSSIRCLISGSIFAAFTTTSTERLESIMSRTADAPRTFTDSMESRIQIGFLITTSLCGALRRATDLDLPF